jgi:serine/threonine protein kinase
MPKTDPWTGVRLARRYTLLGRIGQGNMGEVYLARDDHLGTDVVVKFPVTTGAATDDPKFRERFDRETRSMIRLSHPHVVKVIDAGRHQGRPFVVMQYLSGGSLKDRMTTCSDGQMLPMPPASLGGWLMDVARALDFLHAQGFIHRDVKPANILFDAHGHAYLGDFGIVKAVRAAAEDPRAGALTSPGFLLGTPNYVAPEVVMGREADGRVDQYALAMTVHEFLSGRNVMAGPSPSATVVNQMNLVPPPVAELVAGIPPRLSEALQRALAKEPSARFEGCVAFAREALADLADVPEVAASLAGGSGQIATVGRASSSGVSPPTVYGPGADALADPSAATIMAPASRRGGPSRRAALAAAALAVLAGGAWIVHALSRGPSAGPGDLRPGAGPAAVAPAEPAPVTINIAYGTEKKAWLEKAVADYRGRPEGQGVTINLIGMGSVEGAQAVLAGAKPTPIHVWSPASAAYRGVFEREWRTRHGDASPIARGEALALTPMVFVMWKPRYEAFLKKYGAVTFRTVAAAAREPGGWAAIGGKPEWGHFKFGHTHPNMSNSGMLTLVLMAYEFSGKQRGLSPSDVTDAGFQSWLRDLEQAVTRHGGSLTHSTGILMNEMVLRGPSQYDCLVLYENLAVEYLERARGLWGDLFVCYPEPNLWNEHPYYILDVPWSGPAERVAAGKFLDYLLSEPVQRQALAYGFRPGNPSIPVRVPGSPLIQAEPSGVRIDVPSMAEPPSADVVDDLLSSYLRIEPR